MSSLWAPSNVYIVNILHKSFQYGINVRGNIQIKMFQRSSQINVRFTNRSRVFGFFLPWSRCWYFNQCGYDPRQKDPHSAYKKFYWNKVATFLASFVKWQTPIRLMWGGQCNIIPHQQLMTPGPVFCCTHLHTSWAHVSSSARLSSTLNISGDKNHPWPGVRRRSLSSR